MICRIDMGENWIVLKWFPISAYTHCLQLLVTHFSCLVKSLYCIHYIVQQKRPKEVREPTLLNHSGYSTG